MSLNDILKSDDSTVAYYANLVNPYWLAEADACAAELVRRTRRREILRSLRNLRRHNFNGTRTIIDGITITSSGGDFVLRDGGYTLGMYDRKRAALAYATWLLLAY